MSSPKPHLVAGNPEKSILSMYDNGFKRLVDYFEKKSKKNEK